MATFLYKTRGNSSPERKPRVYFTCHPEDFEKYFEKVCEDIFKTQDCAVFYTETMTEEIEEKYKESDLGQMNLFVIPVTFKLLSKPNRAMDSDFRYAKEKHIPVLPIMMEMGIDEFYSAKDKFGEAQYLSPYVHDMTAISYEEKLKKYLESVLISNEMAERIRKAFDAYIFLSYRKKDRHYANQLMKLIHSHPEFRDIAIWYDEFLTPGESFRANIEKMMQDSKLFTLLVTPNLLEYVDGKPNYVMAHEYPDARKAGMDILPTEMVKTNRAELRSKYVDIPECVNPNEDELFKNRLLDSLSKIAISANNADPEHNFLIGLAYLDGIDVEKNTERGIELITMAAEANLLEAIENLIDIYHDGIGTQVDYKKTAFWRERVWEYYKQQYGETAPCTLRELRNLAFDFHNLGDYQKALGLHEKFYKYCCELFGQQHPDTLIAINDLANIYNSLGEYRKALNLLGDVYPLCCRIFGTENFDTLDALNELARTYDLLGEHLKASELYGKAYKISCNLLGKEHPTTLMILSHLACTYNALGNHMKALNLHESIYDLLCQIHGNEHPHTLTVLHNQAKIYDDLEDYTKALEIYKKIYPLRCKILGKEHPHTLITLHNFALHYGKTRDHEKALKIHEKVHALQCKILGEEHPNTLDSLSCIAYTYVQLGNAKKSFEIGENAYLIQYRTLGKENALTITTLFNLAYAYGDYGNYQKSLELYESVYAIQHKIFGEEHPDTLNTLGNLAYTHGELGNYKKALELNENAYTRQCEILGEEHHDTMATLNNLARTEDNLGNHVRAFELQTKLYKLGCKVWGKDDPQTIKSKERLEEYRAKLSSQNNSDTASKKPSFFQRIFKKKL